MIDWPDWTGETAVVVANGPSAAGERLEYGRERARFIAIKSSYRLCPWADVLYGTDRGWWLANQGATDFGGLRITASPTISKVYSGVRLIKLTPHGWLQMGEIGVCSGEHSGAIAINLAAQFGAKRILLIGFDMALDHRRREPGVARFDDARVERWRKSMDEHAPRYRQHGLTIINCSMSSRLNAYTKMPFAEAIDGSDDPPAAA